MTTQPRIGLYKTHQSLRSLNLSFCDQTISSERDFFLAKDKQYRIYHLIDQVLTEGENRCKRRKSKKLAQLAKRLLKGGLLTKIHIYPSNGAALKRFIDQMIKKAKAILENSDSVSEILRECALSLASNVNDQTLERFIKQYLQERILALEGQIEAT